MSRPFLRSCCREQSQHLTGLPAGVRVNTGQFEDGTVNGNVEVRLLEFAMALRDFNKQRDDPEETAPEEE